MVLEDLADALRRLERISQQEWTSEDADILVRAAAHFVDSTTNHCWKAWWNRHGGKVMLGHLLNGRFDEITELHRRGLKELLRAIAQRIERRCEIDKREPWDREKKLVTLFAKLRGHLRKGRKSSSADSVYPMIAPDSVWVEARREVQ